jgi:hypothetical protein
MLDWQYCDLTGHLRTDQLKTMGDTSKLSVDRLSQLSHAHAREADMVLGKGRGVLTDSLRGHENDSDSRS